MDDYKWYPSDFQPKKHQNEPKPNIPQSTALVVAPPMPQKVRKPKTWLVVITTALITSMLCCVFTAALLHVPYVRERLSSSVSTIIYRDGADMRPKADVSILTNQTGTSDARGTVLSVVEIAQEVGPAVVGIVCEGQYGSDIFLTPSIGSSSGSGIIISGDGYILTNAHVVDKANKITVILSTQKEYTATVIGKDSKTDLAVIKIEETGLPTAVLGNSNDVQVGELCVAIGNPLGQELAGSVTTGCISAINRTVTVDRKQYTLLQTDAAINPGNSGGALVNAYGEVIGINSVKMASTDVEGIGFAIPSDVAKPIISDLISVGYVQGRPLIGIINGRTVTPQLAKQYNLPEGIYVTSIAEFSGAELAGIQAGDVIIKCDGEDVKTLTELDTIRDKHKSGEQITLTIVRNGETKDFVVTLTEEKPEPESNSDGYGNIYPTIPYYW